MNFVMNKVIDLQQINKLPGCEEVSNDLISQILEEAGKVSSVLSESNLEGDQVSSKRNDDGSVTTPPGFKESYKTLGEGGWTSLEAKEEFGGQQMPTIISAAVNEIWHSANMSLALCHLLTQGLIYALQKSASKEQQDLFIPPLVEGRWTGTMNLTEPQAGTDLAVIKTKAVKQGDHYLISGQKNLYHVR
jgi:alkylation response protein AidB-like acyl-CoA dehydrogenase